MTLKKLDEAPLNPMKMNMKSPWKSYEVPRKKKTRNGTQRHQKPALATPPTPQRSQAPQSLDFE
jgi:hypothetical protein